MVDVQLDDFIVTVNEQTAIALTNGKLMPLLDNLCLKKQNDY